MLTKKVSESINDFVCEKCNYITGVKSNYKKHCATARHLNLTNLTENVSDDIISELRCITCNKIYKSRMGLWQHSKKCSPDDNKNIIIENPVKEVTNNIIDTNLVLELIKQNKELQNLLVQQSNEHKTMLVQQSNENKTMFVQQSKENSELVNKLIEREPGGNTINSNNTINNNQKFNLNFFLNETCKDAMSIQEFLANIRITFDDLLTIGNTGFVNGVSDIFIKQLRDLEVNKRPIHCTDSKRETIYFKEEDVWNKDDKEKTRLKQLIEKVEYRNVVALRDWCNENPDAKVNNTPNNLLKDKIYLQTLQGDDKTRDKIIKNISREVTVDKENITNNLIT